MQPSTQLTTWGTFPTTLLLTLSRAQQGYKVHVQPSTQITMWETMPTTQMLILSGAHRVSKDHVQPSTKLNNRETIPTTQQACPLSRTTSRRPVGTTHTQNIIPTLCQQAYYRTGSWLELLHCMISLTDYLHQVGQV